MVLFDFCGHFVKHIHQHLDPGDGDLKDKWF